VDVPMMPAGLVEERCTPVFDAESVPVALTRSHHTTVWAELRVEAGVVHFLELEGTSPRDLRVEAGERVVIVPGVRHSVELSGDARFHVQFYREPSDS
jgi:tellurite resistance-related uncharacterized protein